MHILIIIPSIFSNHIMAVTGIAAVNPADIINSANTAVKPPSINELVNSFKSLSKTERKARIM